MPPLRAPLQALFKRIRPLTNSAITPSVVAGILEAHEDVRAEAEALAAQHNTANEELSTYLINAFHRLANSAMIARSDFAPAKSEDDHTPGNLPRSRHILLIKSPSDDLADRALALVPSKARHVGVKRMHYPPGAFPGYDDVLIVYVECIERQYHVDVAGWLGQRCIGISVPNRRHTDYIFSRREHFHGDTIEGIAGSSTFQCPHEHSSDEDPKIAFEKGIKSVTRKDLIRKAIANGASLKEIKEQWPTTWSSSSLFVRKLFKEHKDSLDVMGVAKKVRLEKLYAAAAAAKAKIEQLVEESQDSDEVAASAIARMEAV